MEKQLVYSTSIRSIKDLLNLKWPDLTEKQLIGLTEYCAYFKHKLIYDEKRKKAFIINSHTNNLGYIQKCGDKIRLLYNDKSFTEINLGNFVNELIDRVERGLVTSSIKYAFAKAIKEKNLVTV